MSITSNANSTFLNVDNAHLRVSGDIHATAVKVGAIEIVPGYSLESTTGIGNTTPHTVEFTNTETSLVTSGDINMLHSSNNATIKLNSNVVTEFPRSKKLIKYPSVALTGPTSGGYTAQTSSINVSTQDAWYAFDNSEPGDATSRWRTTSPRYTNSGATPPSEYLFTGSEAGDWISIQLPEKMKLVYYTMTGIHTHTPQEGVIYGYDSDTSTWHKVSTFYFNTTSYPVNNTPLFSPEFHTEEGVGLYSKYAMIVTKTNGSDAPSLYEWKLYGIPEYDPDADGVDVKVTSYPNVPNTDWLEVYYDAKDLTSVSGTIADLSGKSVTGTLNGDVSLDTSNNVKSFSFDGSGDYISGTLTNTGDFDFTVSTWINRNVTGSDHTIWQIGLGSNNNNPNVSTCLSISNEQLDYFIFSGPSAKVLDYADKYPTQTWVHIVCERVGNDLFIFINGIRQQLEYSGTPSDTLSIVSNSTFHIGARTGTQLGVNPMNGKIANFRLFNRALTTDEVWQLYAYQKEEFGHGDLSMTLKAGRLGIGTSEPRAALDVRGDIVGGCPVYFHVGRSLGHVASTNKIIYNSIRTNKGGGYDTTSGNFTAPVSGWYYFYFKSTTRSTSPDVVHMSLRKNDETSNLIMAYTRIDSNTLYLINTAGTLYLTEGEYVSVYVTSGTVSASGGIGGADAEWLGFLLSAE